MNKLARTALIAPGMTALALVFGACSMNAPVSPEAPRGRTMYATTQDNRMAKFGSENPNTSATTIAFSGMTSGETMIGLDFGPKDGKLYGISNQNRIYTIDVTTGAVTVIGSSAFGPTLLGASFGLDFNPTVNRIRVHSDADFNVRLNQETGLVVDFDLVTAGIQADLNLNYTAGDAGAGSDPSVVATAYTNSNASATTTTLFAIDSSRDVLVTVNPPNDGKLTTIGQLGVDTSTAAGFDISGAADGTAFATLTAATGVSSLYTINLSNGQATLIGAVGGNLTLTGVAVAP
jgi:Domain of unknown function (DUF4394)